MDFEVKELIKLGLFLKENNIDFGNIMDITTFQEYCETGCLIDYDGFGQEIILEDCLLRLGNNISPSGMRNININAQYIVWWNR